MKKFLKFAAATWLVTAGLSAHAQVGNYIQDIKIPAQLPPQGAMVPERSVYYLKTPGYFGTSVVSPEQAKLRMPDGANMATVWVEFKSAILSAAINEQLKIRGVRLASSKESADLVLRGYGPGGDAYYYSANHPYRGKRISLDERMDSANLLEAGASDGSRTVARSVWDLAPAYKFRGADPVSFGVGVFSALFDATGLSSALARARNDEEKMKLDSWLLSDCFDKETRAATSCLSEAQRLESYRRKVRIQAVELNATFGRPGGSSNEYQHVQLISRQIDSRSATDISLAELLGAAVSELVSGLGQVQAQAPKD